MNWKSPEGEVFKCKIEYGEYGESYFLLISLDGKRVVKFQSFHEAKKAGWEKLG